MDVSLGNTAIVSVCLSLRSSDIFFTNIDQNLFRSRVCCSVLEPLFVIYWWSQDNVFLRPTVVSMYNYMQPVVATIVSVSLGLAALTFNHFYCCCPYFYRSLACCTFKIEARYLFFSLILRDFCPTILLVFEVIIRIRMMI